MDLSAFTVDIDSTLLDAATAIAKNHSRCVIVTSNTKVAGVISEGDIIRALIGGSSVHSNLRDFIQYGLFFLDTYDEDKALDIFVKTGISLIPVVNPNFEIVEIITLIDMLAKVRLH